MWITENNNTIYYGRKGFAHHREEAIVFKSVKQCLKTMKYAMADYVPSDQVFAEVIEYNDQAVDTFHNNGEVTSIIS